MAIKTMYVTVSTHSRAEAAALILGATKEATEVSTHSRAEAAAKQPSRRLSNMQFQHTAARRRLLPCSQYRTSLQQFQHTAARRRLLPGDVIFKRTGGFNTQPRGGGCAREMAYRSFNRSFNTQPRGGGCLESFLNIATGLKFQHTAARRRLPALGLADLAIKQFQHTAARRRLRSLNVSGSKTKSCFNTQPRGGGCHSTPISSCQKIVSTHSRAEAAADYGLPRQIQQRCFNTQPRGGGCRFIDRLNFDFCRFNTQPRGGGCFQSAVKSCCVL